MITDFTIEIPTKADVPEIMALTYPDYFHESYVSEGMDFGEEETKKTYEAAIDGVAFVAKHEGKIIAFACMVMFKTFYKQTIAEVPLFFVTPICRGSQIGREMARQLIAAFERNGGGKMLITASSRHEEHNKMVENLWKKFGFQARHGITMIKEV